jgi:hypothetical protein
MRAITWCDECVFAGAYGDPTFARPNFTSDSLQNTAERLPFTFSHTMGNTPDDIYGLCTIIA